MFAQLMVNLKGGLARQAAGSASATTAAVPVTSGAGERVHGIPQLPMTCLPPPTHSSGPKCAWTVYGCAARGHGAGWVPRAGQGLGVHWWLTVATRQEGPNSLAPTPKTPTTQDSPPPSWHSTLATCRLYNGTCSRERASPGPTRSPQGAPLLCSSLNFEFEM